MTTQHTPGPWILTKCVGTGGVDCGWDVDETSDYRGSICHLTDAEQIDGITIAERDANACLISAAPELLAALESAVADRTGCHPEPEWMPTARAAIAKAKGQP